MSVSDQTKLVELQTQSTNLRQELKDWEKSFSAANEGRKAGRDDIKEHPTIASKYKEYTKLRDILSGKASSQRSSSPPPAQPVQSSQRASRKRKHPPPHTDQTQIQTPRKLPRHELTPSKPTPLHPSHLDPYDSPSSIRRLFTASHLRTSIGPTPQRDGKVLGLFESFPDAYSPLRTSLAAVPTNAQTLNLNQTTPSKPRATPNDQGRAGSISDLDSAIKRKQSRTPTSTGKRFLLDTYTFATPTAARRRTLDPFTGEPPTSISKLQFSTPAFLRRDSRPLRPSLAENGDENDDDDVAAMTSPVAVRMPPSKAKPFVRGLSSMLAGLRRMEDERLDEEMDILRDVEMGAEADVGGARRDSRGSGGGVLVRDSQVQGQGLGYGQDEDTAGTALSMPLGVDRGSSDDDNDDDTSDHNSETQSRSRSRTYPDRKNQKLYKKKGQKRTTRRVTMKPSRAKPKPEPAWPEPSSPTTDKKVYDMHHPPDDDVPPPESQERSAAAATGTGTAAGETKTGKKKKKKMVAATAHANFTRLKLRGKGAKPRPSGAGGGRGGRFGRRR
ncbi:DNA replication regulator sld2 [Acarospora aff. strigata]|nr:DNA replication regulator sld2 [Acarospora aff. strigata]